MDALEESPRGQVDCGCGRARISSASGRSARATDGVAGNRREPQVIVTTHSQALVNRPAIEQNVIVSNRGARPANSLDDLRAALGVRLSDALASTEVIVITEGWLDDQVL